MGGELEPDDLQGPFQPIISYDSMIYNRYILTEAGLDGEDSFGRMVIHGSLNKSDSNVSCATKIFGSLRWSGACLPYMGDLCLD